MSDIFEFVKTGHEKYPYKLTKEVSVDVGNFPDLDHEFFMIKDGVLTLRENYAIDGVTAWIDFDGLMPGAFVHDALLQAIELGLMPGSYRSKTHALFYKYARKNNIPRTLSAQLAYLGLKVLHEPWRSINKLFN